MTVLLEKNNNFDRYSMCDIALKPLCLSNKELSPTSGFEIAFEPEFWAQKNIKNSTNCFSYAINKSEGFSEYKCLDLGMISGKLRDENTPEEYIKLLFEDIKNIGGEIFPIKFNEKCPEDFYKIALVYRPHEIKRRIDYHFYRQNPDGTWSHKHPFKEPTNLDIDNKLIINPQNANRGDYKEFLGYYAIKKIDWTDSKINEKVNKGYNECWNEIIRNIDQR